MWDSKRDIDVKNRLLDSVGEGEGGMIWENSIEACVILAPQPGIESLPSAFEGEVLTTGPPWKSLLDF